MALYVGVGIREAQSRSKTNAFAFHAICLGSEIERERGPRVVSARTRSLTEEL